MHVNQRFNIQTATKWMQATSLKIYEYWSKSNEMECNDGLMMMMSVSSSINNNSTDLSTVWPSIFISIFCIYHSLHSVAFNWLASQHERCLCRWYFCLSLSHSAFASSILLLLLNFMHFFTLFSLLEPLAILTIFAFIHWIVVLHCVDMHLDATVFNGI